MRAIAGEYGSAVGAHLHLLPPRAVVCRAPTCDLRFQAVAGGYRTCSCIVRVRQSYSCILCTHVTKPLSYTLPDRSRPRQRRSSAAIRLQQVHNTMDACTPPAHSERLARDRAGAGRPLHMRRRTLRALRPRPRHLQPARRSLRADSHRCPQQLRTVFGAAGASYSGATIHHIALPVTRSRGRTAKPNREAPATRHGPRNYL